MVSTTINKKQLNAQSHTKNRMTMVMVIILIMLMMAYYLPMTFNLSTVHVKTILIITITI